MDLLAIVREAKLVSVLQRDRAANALPPCRAVKPPHKNHNRAVQPPSRTAYGGANINNTTLPPGRSYMLHGQHGQQGQHGRHH